MCRCDGCGRTWLLTHALMKTVHGVDQRDDVQQTGRIWLHHDTEAWLGASHFSLKQENDDKTVLSSGAGKTGKHSFNCCRHGGSCTPFSPQVPSLDLVSRTLMNGGQNSPEYFSSCVFYHPGTLCVCVCTLCVLVHV